MDKGEIIGFDEKWLGASAYILLYNDVHFLVKITFMLFFFSSCVNRHYRYFRATGNIIYLEVAYLIKSFPFKNFSKQ